MQLPKEIFENMSGVEQVINEGQSFYIIDQVDFKDGTRVWIRGAQYHQKGMALADTLFATNMVKRMLVEGLKIALRPEFIPGIVIIALKPSKWRIKSISSLIQSYNSMSNKVLSPFVMKPEFMIPTARELRSVTSSFLKYLGVEENIANDFGKIFSHMFEYDNAYRFRLIDILTETTKEKLANKPIRELLRLGKIIVQRDTQNVSWKAKGLVTILSITLILPSFRKAFKKAILESDFAKLQYDEVDRYWTAMRNDYLWWGLGVEERSKYNEGKNIPAPVPRAEYEALLAQRK